MAKPIVAIVGRPNVGKSTLFNRIAGERISIVEDTPGVTRDRIYADAEWLDHHFTLIDTGGLEPDSDDMMLKHMYSQAEIAISSADVILFVVDVRTGMTDMDMQVANILRKADKPVVLAVNKVDDLAKYGMQVYEFYSLGLGDPFGVSGGQMIGLGDLLDEVVKHFPADKDDSAEDDAIKVAIIGKPNVGKSSLVNRILGENRVIVSDVAGTTRDAIDSEYELNGQKYVFIDTAGMRRKAKIKESIEKYSIIRAVAAVERADVCILMINAVEGITEQDAKIAGIAHENGKGVIIAVNKWDIANRQEALQKLNDKLQTSLTQAEGVPTVTISALKKEGLDKLMSAVFKVYDRWNVRIPTAPLNKWFEDIKDNCPPPLGKNKRRIKLRYITQAKTRPPSFYMFSSNPEGLPDSYLRYLTNSLRETFNLGGIPIRLNVRKTGNPYADKKERRNPLRKMAKPKE